MAAKKKQAKAPKAPKLTAAQKRSLNKEPKVLALPETTLLKLEKLSTQIRAIDSELVIAQSLRTAYLQKIDVSQELPRFDSKITTLKTERQQSEEAYRALTKATEDDLGIKLADYAYDDVTGVLRKIGEDDEGGSPT